MHNILMFCFRRINKYGPGKVAAFLGITTDEYLDIEKGLVMLPRTLTDRLGKLYKIDGKYFYEAALQLEDLLTQRAVIKILQNENERLNELMQGGYELIHASKTKSSKVET